MNHNSSTHSPEAAALSKGRARLYPAISCVTFVPNGAIYPTQFNYFDVPCEDYSDGALTGAKVAWEALAASADVGGPGVLESIIKTAAAVAAEPVGTGHSRVGAAVGFLAAISSVLYDAACAGRIHAVMAEEISGHEAAMQTDLDDMRAHNKAFIASMMPAASKPATRGRRAAH